ncbi:hypothetical protein [Bifidobacterium thermophilum]|uniref:hypothetical protein n=1 Tax=Bifidobacterium thermophilum TaxID=33905 RepID=UPI003F8F387F
MNTKHSLTALTVFEAAQPYLFWLLVMFPEMNLDEDGRFLDAIPWVSICWVVATVIVGGVYVWLSRGGEFRTLARNAMIIKLVHIPYYLLVFALAVVSIVLSLKIPFITLTVWAFCFVADATLIVTSGLYELAAVIAGVRCKRMTGGQGVVFAIAGFLFCVDVVIAVVTYVKSREVVTVGVRPGNGVGVAPGVGADAMPSGWAGARPGSSPSEPVGRWY